MSTVLRCIRLGQDHSVTFVSTALGIPVKTVNTWLGISRLPVTGNHTVEKMVELLHRAEMIWRRKGTTPMNAMREATESSGLKWSSIKVFMFAGCFPAIPTFPLYADPVMQMRAEQIGRGLRRHVSDEFEAAFSGTQSDPQSTKPAPMRRPSGRPFLVGGWVSKKIPSRPLNHISGSGGLSGTP